MLNSASEIPLKAKYLALFLSKITLSCGKIFVLCLVIVVFLRGIIAFCDIKNAWSFLDG